MKTVFAFLLVSGAAAGVAGAAQVGIASGSATLAFDLNTMLTQTPLDALNAAFGITETRTQCLNLPNNNPGSVLSWAINPVGTPTPAGRSVQGTTLTIDPTDVLGSWTGGSDSGAFLSGGEQIGFGGMSRWVVDSAFGGGKLLFGDWGLRYSASRAGTAAGATSNIRSGLVLTSNIDFLNATFVDIGNASIVVTGNTLSITGDLLVSNGLLALGFPASNLGLDVGDFSLTATLVPAPGAAALLGLGVFAASRRRRGE